MNDELAGMRTRSLYLETVTVGAIRSHTRHALEWLFEIKVWSWLQHCSFSTLLHIQEPRSGAQSAKSEKNIPAPHVRPLWSRNYYDIYSRRRGEINRKAADR